MFRLGQFNFTNSAKSCLHVEIKVVHELLAIQIFARRRVAGPKFSPIFSHSCITILAVRANIEPTVHVR